MIQLRYPMMVLPAIKIQKIILIHTHRSQCVAKTVVIEAWTYDGVT